MQSLSSEHRRQWFKSQSRTEVGRPYCLALANARIGPSPRVHVLRKAGAKRRDVSPMKEQARFGDTIHEAVGIEYL